MVIGQILICKLYLNSNILRSIGFNSPLVHPQFIFDLAPWQASSRGSTQTQRVNYFIGTLNMQLVHIGTLTEGINQC